MSSEGLLNRAAELEYPADSEVIDLLPLEEEQSNEPLAIPKDAVRCVKWTEINQGSAIPLLLFDNEMKVRWRNDTYRKWRESQLQIFDYADRTFDSFFPTFTGQSTTANVKRTGLFAALGNRDSGFGWQGSVEGVTGELRKFTARLTITPETRDEDGQPVLFRASFDDITVEQDHLTLSNFEGILRASLLKDEDTTNHVRRVNAYSKSIAEELRKLGTAGDSRWFEVSVDFIADICNLAAFHDVGKIGTPESILLKPGKLDDEEWTIMKEHPTSGAFILSSHPNPMARDIAHYHHEKWDGSGYPYGIQGTNIPLSARIVTLADVYDALRTRRPYKEPFSEEKTSSIINEGSGTHFDPGLVEAFMNMRKDFDRISRELAD